MYQTEKFVKDNEDKVDADLKGRVETAIEEAKSALAGSDISAVKSAGKPLAAPAERWFGWKL